MSAEAAFLAAIAASPADPLPRLVYADYLDDHDDPVRAELVRLEVELAAGRGSDNDRDWFRALAQARDPDWLAKIVRPEVGRCGLRFRFACTRRWADMVPTTDPTRRECEGCQRPVFLCTTWAEAVGRAGSGDCVAVDRRLVALNHLRPSNLTESVSSGLVEFDFVPPPPPARLPKEDAMGVELRLVALAPVWGLIELARNDREHGDSLALLPLWFTGSDGPLAPGRADERDDPFWQTACRLAGDHPDLSARVLDLDRRFDALHWLLSATRRRPSYFDQLPWPERQAYEADPTPADAEIDRLFGDGPPVADHVRATQGRAVVRVPAATVFVAAGELARVTAGDIRRRFDPGRMGRAGIYKFVPGQDDAGWLAVAERQLGELQRFLGEAATRGDELIVVVD